ncbi:MAG: VOC family protein [Nitrospirales bacterium]|nr:VOC family protein [Nitrospirales bacterium]
MARLHGAFPGAEPPVIPVKHTQASLRFFRDTLGMRIVEESGNYGTEQGSSTVLVGQENDLVPSQSV